MASPNKQEFQHQNMGVSLKGSLLTARTGKILKNGLKGNFQVFYVPHRHSIIETKTQLLNSSQYSRCLLYTSDAADE